MKKVLMFAPVESENSYKGGIISIINAYLDHNSLFQKNNYSVAYDPNPCGVVVKPRKTIIEKVIFHTRYIARHYKNLCNALNKESIDVIHMHTSRDIRLFDDLCIANLVKKKKNCVVVVSIHRADLTKTITNYKIIQKLYLHLLKGVNRIVFLSERTRLEFIEAGIPSKSTSHLPTFHTYEGTSTPKEYNDLNTLKLLYMGFISKEKGVGELLEAMKGLPTNIELTICGGIKDGETQYYSDVANNPDSRIQYKGYVDGKEKIQAFLNSDVFILPSYGEGLPLVVLEALHFGLPIITTKVGAIPEVLQNGVNGMLIEPKDKDAIIQAVLNLTCDKETLKAISKENILLSKKYSIEWNIDKLCKIYDT